MGEFEHIKPFIRSFKNRIPKSSVVVMFFSPSGYEHIKAFPGVDLFIYSPFDWWLPVMRTYKILKPSALVIAKHDVWPNQVWVAAMLKIPCFLINASLHKGSRRLKPFIRMLQKSIYNKLSLIITVSQNDAKNYLRFVPKEKIVIAGDTKFEQVILRMEESRKKEIIPEKIWEGKKVLVAGSIWHEDEEHLLPVFKKLSENYQNLLLIACPHEPTDSHIESLRHSLLPLNFCLYSRLDDYNGEQIIVIDTVGLLANLYSMAEVSYVGGGFKQKVHNVLEPAVYGIPVMFGPVNQNSNEAQLLKEAGGGIEVQNSEEIETALNSFFSDDFYRKKIGAFASKVVMDNTGATRRTIEAIMPFVKQ